jgi:hypothetical protein
MSEWTFAVAQRAIDEATAVLAQRDQVEALAAGLGLAPYDAARSAYETATADFGRANAIVQDQLEALAAIEGARSASAGSLDPVAQLGLLGGATPAGAYDAARAAFERGELDAAIASAAAAASLLAGATALGQQRFVMIGAAAAVLLLAAVLLVWRRRRRGRALASVGSSAGAAAPRDMLRDPPGASIAPPAAPGVPPASDWPPRDLAPRQVLDQPEPAWWLPTRSSPDPATLAADPAAPSPPSAANESEMEGGAPPRDPPDDASG